MIIIVFLPNRKKGEVVTKQSFLYGTIVLIVASMLTRFLGFINRMITARLMGEEGIGLYMLVMPTLFLLLTLTQIGLPLAISKNIAEAYAKNDEGRIRKIMTYAFIIITCTSIFFTVSLILFAPTIATYLLTDERTEYLLYALAPAIPVIAFSSLFKGYFQGLQNMKPQSIGLVIEQIVRIGFVYVAIHYFIQFGIVHAAVSAVVSITIGEIASFLFLYYQYKKNRLKKKQANQSSHILSSLLTIALPHTTSKLVQSFSNFLEPIFVTKSLKIAGYSTIDATKQYGELTGFVMPLLFLPTFITNSISVALLPSVSMLQTRNEQKVLFERMEQAIRFSFLSGAVATIIFILFANTILTYIYGTSNASLFVKMMAPFFLCLYIHTPLQTILISLNYAREVMWNNILGAIVKFSILIMFTSHPTFGIYGVVIALNMYVLFVMCLHFLLLYRRTKFFPPLKNVFRLVLLFISTYAVAYILKMYMIIDRILIFIILLCMIVLLYIFFIFLFRCITKEEFVQFKNILWKK